jgi:hypothetical protein
MSLPFVTSSTVVNEGANRGILAEIKEPAQRSREAGARGRVDQAKMTVLILRTIGIKDCAVIDNGHPIGRIRKFGRGISPYRCRAAVTGQAQALKRQKPHWFKSRTLELEAATSADI